MSDKSKNSTRESKSGKAFRSFTKADLAPPLFILGGSGALYVTLLCALLAFYSQQRFLSGGFLIHYAPALLFLPTFLVALMRWHGASIPLWVVFLWFLIPSFLPSHQLAAGVGGPQPGIGILSIPLLVQLARYFRTAKQKPR